MNRSRTCLLLALLAACAAPSAAPKSAAKKSVEIPIPADLEPQIERAKAIGIQLYLHDVAGWIATDALRDKIGNLDDKGIGGYLAFREGDDNGREKDSFLVTFYTREHPVRAAYEIRVTPGPFTQTEFRAFEPPKPTLPAFDLLARARQAAIDSLPEIMQPLNPVLLPADEEGEVGFAVYLLAATYQPDVVVLGRHYRVLVAEDGNTVMEVRPLSNAIIEVPLRSAKQRDPGRGRIVIAGDGTPISEVSTPNRIVSEATEEDSALILVINRLTDWPLETHVFASLSYKRPIAVGTGRGIWLVNGADVTLVDDEFPRTTE